MFQKKKGLTRRERLCKQSDLKYLFKYGKKNRYKGLKILYLKNNIEVKRVAVIAKKGFSRAVKRNRQKRLVKEAYRNLKSTLKNGFDIILFVIPGNYSYKEYLLMVKFLFDRSQLQKNI